MAVSVCIDGGLVRKQLNTAAQIAISTSTIDYAFATVNASPTYKNFGLPDYRSVSWLYPVDRDHFRSQNKDENQKSLDNAQMQKLASAGKINVKLHCITNIRRTVPCALTPRSTSAPGAIPEKAMKGKGDTVSHQTT